MDATTFLDVAETAERSITAAEVEERWDEPSALTGYTVGGLAGHLARAVLTVERYLERPPADGTPTDAAGYLVRVLGSHDPVDSDFHAAVRERGRQEAAVGPAELVERLRAARETLATRLAAIDPEVRLAVLDDTVLTVADYLDTRLIELVVHLDDLAVSVGHEAPPELPQAAYETVATVLARVAVRRVGPLATVRSLARRERHPEAVRAL